MFALLSVVQADLQINIDDPTRPPGLDAAPAGSPNVVNKQPRWILRSILLSPERRTAVINDRVVSIGDKISGASVVEIGPATVRLRSHRGYITLKLVKNNVKTISKQPHQEQGNQ